MIETLLAVFTGGGAVGLGSLIKIGAGFIDSYSQRKELREHRKILESNASAEAFQKQAFSNTTSGTIASITRCLLALVGVSTLAICTAHCTLFPQDAFITIQSTAAGGVTTEPYSILWGFVTLPRNETPIQLTLGHAALSNFIGFQMILGYYFTPGGRK
jgi:hypothetical protein